MIRDPDFVSENGAPKIAAFFKNIAEAKLLREDDDWYAVFVEVPI